MLSTKAIRVQLVQYCIFSPHPLSASRSSVDAFCSFTGSGKMIPWMGEMYISSIERTPCGTNNTKSPKLR